VEQKFRPIQKKLKDEVLASGWFEPQAVWGYFPAQGDGNDVVAYDVAPASKVSLSPTDPPPTLRELVRFSFPCQKDGRRLCLADFFLPKSSGRMDVIAWSPLTAGPQGDAQDATGVRRGRIHKVSVLARFECGNCREAGRICAQDHARGAGHRRRRFSHVRDLFHQKHRGSRYSFGYPACPNLEDQTKLLALLHPEENVGVRLTTGFLLEPEQSTSAIVVHHPAAKYFMA
jgi:5-methyltetrahydrofolate--homocysteine methyltransferase